MNFTSIFSWFVLFVAMGLKITSLVFILLMYNDNKKKNDIDADATYMDNDDNTLVLSGRSIYIFEEYKGIYIFSMIIIFLFLYRLLYSYSSINVQIMSVFDDLMDEFNKNNIIRFSIHVLMIFVGLCLLYITASEVFIGYNLYKKDKRKIK
jgi:hypothetical protein